MVARLAMAFLPDNFATLLETTEKRTLIKGVVLRQQLLRLAMKGIDATKASRITGCHYQTARSIYRDPVFRKEVFSKVDRAFVDVDKAFQESKKSLHERLVEEAEFAFDQLCSMLRTEETLPSLKVKIAQDFLDRNPESQAGHTVMHAPALASEQLAHAARVAREVDAKIMPIRRVS